MILRALVVGLLLLTAAVLETALFPSLTLLGYRPDLLLLVVLAIAMQDGPMSGARVGVISGLLADLLVVQSPVGLSVLIHTGVGYLVGVSRPYLAPDSLSAPLALAFVTAAVGTAGYGIMASLLADERASAEQVVQAALAVGLYNMLLAPIAYAGLRRLSDRFPVRAPTND